MAEWAILLLEWFASAMTTEEGMMNPFAKMGLTLGPVEGTLMTLSAVPFVLACVMTDGEMPQPWRWTAAGLAALCCLAAALLLVRHHKLARVMGGMAMAGCIIAAIPGIVSNPYIALLASVMVMVAGNTLVHFSFHQVQGHPLSLEIGRLQRAWWSAMAMTALAIVTIIIAPAHHVLADGALLATVLVTQALAARWAWRERPSLRRSAWLALAALVAGAAIAGFMLGHVRGVALVAGGLASFLLSSSATSPQRKEPWWESLLSHPERILLTTFLALCVLGTLLLRLPGATRLADIPLVDTAFTSVSAVCVTGLIVLDTPYDFTLLGQALILLLIQLGGLGIMSITTVALHAVGRRMSLRQERLMVAMTDLQHQDLAGAIKTIILFTLAAEGLGALILTGLFYLSGDGLWLAAWHGLFTAVSAFCNAGFSLQSDNLISYRENAWILHVVATLICLGGMAPATSLMIPRWLTGRPVPLSARLALVTTSVLLVGGAILFLALEWKGSLLGLTMVDKIHNAWFQSVTLRTAGFNTVDISGVMAPTLLVMIGLMFIGGSPGGTAGGVKTTTAGILAMTFWAGISGRTEIIAQNRQVLPRTVHRAVTVVGSGFLVWLVVVLMLTITQRIPVRDLIFEATSALGTVGLSTGATGRLDTIGKIIVMIAMFIGRIGPISLFMLLGKERDGSGSRHPDARITLT